MSPSGVNDLSGSQLLQMLISDVHSSFLFIHTNRENTHSVYPLGIISLWFVHLDLALVSSEMHDYFYTTLEHFWE